MNTRLSQKQTCCLQIIPETIFVCKQHVTFLTYCKHQARKEDCTSVKVVCDSFLHDLSQSGRVSDETPKNIICHTDKKGTVQEKHQISVGIRTISIRLVRLFHIVSEMSSSLQWSATPRTSLEHTCVSVRPTA